MNLWLKNLAELERTSQLLEDNEASEFVFRRAWCFTVTTARKRVEVVVLRLESQPGAVGAVRVLEAYKITVFHWSTILCIAGIDLEKGVRNGQPVALIPHLARSPEKTKADQT